ncbi:DUF2892 domain-containing protein [uncultured Roseibium sp.]|uniref:YgaP family membrane protein n=1 Tax=uncultured Roseibium sp. TaxID=1936171 RepID=UPI002606B5F2|nr:DUF2892 domain-containing protein [uncultured Roseibium sp.]
MSIANVGSLDRIVRIVLGAALILAPLLGFIAAASSTLGIVLMIAGAVLVGTGFISFCPIYRIIGASTRSNS